MDICRGHYMVYMFGEVSSEVGEQDNSQACLVLDGEQSLFCSKFRGKNVSNWANTKFKVRVERASSAGTGRRAKRE